MKSVIAFAAIVLVFGCAEAFPQLVRKGCPELCPMIYAPVCGTDGVETRVFSNKCIMNVYACKESKKFVVTRFQDCGEGELGLLTGPGPVVPSEQKLNIVDSFEAKPIRTNCPPCTRIFAPVCGTDGVELKKFSNACMMDYFNCMNARSFHLLGDGVREC